MRTIIAGSRGITDMELLLKAIRKAQRGGLKITTVLCGGANGVDSLGREWAGKNNIPIEYYPADWNKHGKSAGYIRNQEMVDKAEALLVLWDNKSKGTKHIIDLAKKAELKICLVIISAKKKACEREIEREIEREVEKDTALHKRKKEKKLFRIEKSLSLEGAQRRRDRLEKEIKEESEWSDDWTKYEKLVHAEQGLADIEKKKRAGKGQWWGDYLRDYEHRIKAAELRQLN